MRNPRPARPSRASGPNCRHTGVLPGRIRQGPSMYEMEGPGPASLRPARQLPGFADAARRPPVPDTRARDRFPGSSHVPGVAPRVVPVSNSESIPTASASTRARARGQQIPDSSAIHTVPHRKRAVIPTWGWLSTGLLTAVRAWQLVGLPRAGTNESTRDAPQLKLAPTAQPRHLRRGHQRRVRGRPGSCAVRQRRLGQSTAGPRNHRSDSSGRRVLPPSRANQEAGRKYLTRIRARQQDRDALVSAETARARRGHRARGDASVSPVACRLCPPGGHVGVDGGLGLVGRVAAAGHAAHILAWLLLPASRARPRRG